MKTTSEEKLSTSIEDYLKTIYSLLAKGDRASTKKIAEELDVSPASVTSMVKKLSNLQPPLVNYKKYYGVTLTSDGERAALKVIRRHRLLEKYMFEVMGFAWDEVHEEAHQLEHFISPTFEERMAHALKNPEFDPHGAPIPNRDLQMPTHSNLKLSELRGGQCAIIRRVPDDDAELLRYLEKIGVIPGERLEVIEFSPFDELLEIHLKGRETFSVLGLGITKKILVELETTNN